MTVTLTLKLMLAAMTRMEPTLTKAVQRQQNQPPRRQQNQPPKAPPPPAPAPAPAAAKKAPAAPTTTSSNNNKPGGGGDVERRYDTDGGLYTRQEFVEEYHGSTVEWDKAKRQPSAGSGSARRPRGRK